MWSNLYRNLKSQLGLKTIQETKNKNKNNRIKKVNSNKIKKENS